MDFAIICQDKAGATDLRAETRPAHLEYLEANAACILFAGPLLDAAGEKPVGSLLVLDFASLAEAEAFAAGDPYAKAGLFESVTVRPWRKVYPAS